MINLRLTLPAMLLSSGLLLGACSKEHLQPLQRSSLSTLEYATVDARFCTSAPTVARQKIKYLFLLDKSDSNQPGFPTVSEDVSNTDSNGSRRYAPLVQFLRNLPADPAAASYFSMINFNDNGYYPKKKTFIQGFDPNEENFESVVVAEWVGVGTTISPQPLDRGYTNYVSALQLARNLIKADAQYEAGSIERPIVTSSYRIMFVSDGMPNVPAGRGASGIYTQDFTRDIEPVIAQTLALKNDPVLGSYISEISLGTAYYFTGAQAPEAVALLQQMADAGNGQFMKFGAGENVMYGALAPPIRSIRNQLVDAFAENMNTVWWDDGRLLLDRDGDGLPDEVEQRSGSDPSAEDSDGNGVSDYVEYRLTGKPCQDSACGRSARNNYSVCDGFKPSVEASERVTFPDTDGDGLNDCEEFLLKSDSKKFDSNDDFIPDFTALRNGLAFIPGTSGALAQPQGDGISSYLKLKLGLPTTMAASKVLDYQRRATALDRVTADAGKECYHLRIDPLAVLGADNRIRVTLIENARVISDKPVMRIAEKSFAREPLVTFSEGDFQ